MNLRWRLAVILGVVVAVAVGVAAFSAYIAAQNELMNEVDSSLDAQARDLRSGGEQEDPPPRNSRAPESRSQRGKNPCDNPGANRNGEEADERIAQCVGQGGQIVWSNAKPGEQIPVTNETLQIASEGKGRSTETFVIAGRNYRVRTEGYNGGALQVARSLEPTENVLSGLLARLAVIGIGVTVVAAVIGWFIARRLSRPIENLTATTEHIAHTKDLSAPIAVSRRDEVGRLAESFNTMLSALDTSRRQQQQLVMDASHELRTPLTTLRTNIELLDRAPELDPAERQELLKTATFELEELSNLVAELVDLATERSQDDLDEDDFNLGDIAERLAERARRRSGRPITVRLQEPGVAHGHSSLVERAVSNLLDNATKFSPEGTAIELRVSGGTVEVSDEGPGIPEGERQRIFDRFYRTDEARTMPGSGLGLAIVNQVVGEHGGRVWATEAPGGGARIGFELPVFERSGPESATRSASPGSGDTSWE